MGARYMDALRKQHREKNRNITLPSNLRRIFRFLGTLLRSFTLSPGNSYILLQFENLHLQFLEIFARFCQLISQRGGVCQGLLCDFIVL